MPRNVDALIWQHFDKTTSTSKNPVKCKLCQKVLERGDSSTKGMWDHLDHKHSAEHKVLIEQKSKAAQSPSIASYVRSSPLSALDKMVARFVARKNLPFTVLDDPDFVALIQKGHLNSKLSEEKSTCSAYLPTLNQLIKVLSAAEKAVVPPSLTRTISRLLGELKRRSASVQNDRLLVLSAMLDPRFNAPMRSDAEEWDALSKQLIQFAMSLRGDTSDEGPSPKRRKVDPSHASSSSQLIASDIWANEDVAPEAEELVPDSPYSNELQIELAQFRQVKSDLRRDDDLFGWWRTRADVFPKLYDIARGLFSVRATSVSSERVFSQAGILYGDKQRNRLGGERAQQLLLIKASLKPLKLAPKLDESDSDDGDGEEGALVEQD